MKLKGLLLLFLLVGSAGVSRANEVDYFTGSGVVNLSTGVPVPASSNATIWLGYFPTNDPSFFQNNQSFSSLLANFTLLSSIQFGQDASGVPGGGGIVPAPDGQYYGTAFGSVPTAPANNPSSQLFIWMFNTNNPTLGNQPTQWAIATNSTWLLPSGSGFIQLDPTTINASIPGALGTWVANGMGGFDITLGVVPEPSTILLGVVGGVAMLGIYRHRRSRAAVV